MANRTVGVHAWIYGMGIYAIMLPSSGSSVAHHDTCALAANPLSVCGGLYTFGLSNSYPNAYEPSREAVCVFL